MYQRVVIVGHLGRAPEMRYTANGTAVANFSVATNRRWTDNDNNQQEETTWFKVVVWGRQAEICSQYLDKGRMVLCEGEIRTDQYTDQQGATRYSWELRASTVRFLNGAGDRVAGFDEAMEASAGGGGGGGHQGGGRRNSGAPAMANQVAEDDIPF